MPQVLIVGAGPSGLILALSLLSNGIAVRIIDKELAHRRGAKGSGIMPRSLELYRLLGLWPDIQAQARVGTQNRLYGPDGITPLKTWHMAPYTEPTPSAPFMNPLTLGQDRLESIMRKHLEERFGVVVELGTELVTFKQDENKVVAHLKKRVHEGEGITETLDVKYLIGTDGGRSGVRKALDISFLGETREESWMLYGDVEIKGLDVEYWHMWGSHEKGGVTVRHTGGDSNPYFLLIGGVPSMSAAEAAVIGSDPARLEQFFRETSGRTDVEFGEWIYHTAHRPNIRMVDTLQKGRVFLAGDAGHTHSPTGGQGLNSSVQDSFNLGWKLALVLKGHSTPALLSSYTSERLPVIAEMLQRTTLLLDQTLNTSLNPTDANAADVSAPDGAWRRGGALLQLGVNYRWSNIVQDERTPKPPVAAGAYGAVSGVTGGPVRAGDRAPDAPGLVVLAGAEEKETTLFDIFVPDRHTVLVLAANVDMGHGAAVALAKIAGGLPENTVRTALVLATAPIGHSEFPHADLIVHDKDSHARTAYSVGPTDEFVVVGVRPDGVIGCITLGMEGLELYLTTLFS